MTFTIDWGVLLTAAGFLFVLGAAFLKNYLSIASTTSRSIANEKRITDLEDELKDHRIATVSNYVTNTNLKDAMSSFSAAIDRLTDRLDRLITEKMGNEK